MKTNTFLGIVGVLLLLGIAALFIWLWRLTGAIDSRATDRPLTTQLMQRKLETTLGLRWAVAEGDLARARRETADLSRISRTLNWYLTDQQHDALREEFRQALERLDQTASDGDPAGTRDAYSELIRGCVNCHQAATSSPIDPAAYELP
jgi:hypothetical protein